MQRLIDIGSFMHAGLGYCRKMRTVEFALCRGWLVNVEQVASGNSGNSSDIILHHVIALNTSCVVCVSILSRPTHAYIDTKALSV